MKNLPDLVQENIELQKIVADKDDIISSHEKFLHAKEKRHPHSRRIHTFAPAKAIWQLRRRQDVIQSELVFTEAEDNAEAEAPEQVRYAWIYITARSRGAGMVTP